MRVRILSISPYIQISFSPAICVREGANNAQSGVCPTQEGVFTVPNHRFSPPVKPKSILLDVNLVGAMYSARLAQYYLLKNESSQQKSIIFIGSTSEHLRLSTICLAHLTNFVDLLGCSLF
jgi:hypothetical protein